MEKDSLFSFIHSIPESMCSHPQPEFLYSLAKKTSEKGEIVEIGTCAGKSTIALGYAQKERGGNPIITIDIYEHPDVGSNLKKAGVDMYVTRVLKRSSLVAVEWKRPIALLWIDGDHRKNGVISDIRNWSKYVIPGGFMAFHDYPSAEHGFNEVWSAVFKCVLSKPGEWRVISDREAGSIVVFQRLEKKSLMLTKKQYFSKKLYWFKSNLRWYIEEYQAQIMKLVGKSE
ncbi:MAG: class I SAM-dependent methyltransferase [Candidatus Omnitrophica bacterium]|nr:class I SAM-dependent methyltransferase [Candidatus Omnitrophota bacterium]